MDEKLIKILEQKISETLVLKDEIFHISKSLEVSPTNKDSFIFGIVIGRLYNSFYYQSRRIQKRDPTKQEFLDFVELLKQHQTEILEKIQRN